MFNGSISLSDPRVLHKPACQGQINKSIEIISGSHIYTPQKQIQT